MHEAPPLTCVSPISTSAVALLQMSEFTPWMVIVLKCVEDGAAPPRGGADAPVGKDGAGPKGLSGFSSSADP